jgi:hypothetical protein
MMIKITSVSVNGKLETRFTPNPAEVLDTDYVAWSNEDSRQGPEGTHLIEAADGSFTYFDNDLLPCPPPSPPYYFTPGSPTDSPPGNDGQTFNYKCKYHQNETGQFTVVASLTSSTSSTTYT